MAQPVSKLLFCKYKPLDRLTRFIFSGSRDQKHVCVCTACTVYTECIFNRVPERKTLPNRFAKAKLPSLYFVDYRSNDDFINNIMTLICCYYNK